MRRYRVEIIVGAVFLALFLALCLKLSPGPKLTPAEVDAYITRMSASAMPEPEKSEFLARMRAWGKADDGESFYLANLLRENNPIKPWPGVNIPPGSPQATNDVYLAGINPMALKHGAFPVSATNAQVIVPGNPPKTNLEGFEPEVDGWSQINLNRWPGRRAFFEVMADPAYLKVMPYKFAANTVVLLPVSPRFYLPDPRLLVGGFLLCILLLIGWVRATRALTRAQTSKTAA